MPDGYVTRESALHAVENAVELSSSELDSIKSSLDALPSANAAEIVHGYWIIKYDGPYKRRRMFCSKCGKHSGIGGIHSNQMKPYCPNCSAMMDALEGKREDELK